MDSAHPLVSVIMPAYNGKRYIREAIDSILQQTYTNFEFIVVDDGSIDNTLQIIQAYKDDRIRLICNASNKGIAYSTNKGIHNSRGKYIALLDDDDIAERDRLRKQVEYLETHRQIDVLGGKTIYIDSEGSEIGRDYEVKRNPLYYKARLLFENVGFSNSTVMYRKAFIDKYGVKYRENFLGMQDFQFYAECSKVGAITALDEWLLKHRIHDGKETEKQRRENSRNRAIVYANIQKNSLKSSGFVLSKNDTKVIIEELAEIQKPCETVHEWIVFGRVLDNIIKQGKTLNIDFQEELVHVCRAMMSGRFSKLNIFACEDAKCLWDME